MTCETCKHWTRLPDKVYQPTEWQKPVGDPIITRYGICSKLDIGWSEPVEDGIAHNPANCTEGGDTVTTGPLFGCIHHQRASAFAPEQAHAFTCDKCGCHVVNYHNDIYTCRDCGEPHGKKKPSAN